MTYAFVVDVPAPAAVYDALHAAIARRAPEGAEGLLVHVGRVTEDGFSVLEVWQSREHKERFDADVVGPALAEVFGGQAPAAAPPVQEFEPRGLLVPSARVLV